MLSQPTLREVKVVVDNLISHTHYRMSASPGKKQIIKVDDIQPQKNGFSVKLHIIMHE